MKLLNISFTKPRYLVLGLALAAGASTVQAQYTGIGTVTPTAALHVARYITPTDSLSTVDSVGAGKEMIRIEGVRNLRVTEKPNYGELLVYNSATGLFRRESIADILNDNGEWVWDTATSTLRPRRATLNGTMGVTATGIGVTGTMAVSGNTTVGGTLAVTGNGTFTANMTVNGNTILATGAGDLVTLANLTRVPVAPATAVPATAQVLLRNSTTNAVEYAQLDDILSSNGMWIENAALDTLRPRLPGYASTIGVGKTQVHIRKNADIDGTLNVDGATTLGSTLDVTGNLTFRSIPHTTPIPVAALDEILMQRAGQNAVEYVTVDELLANSGEWVHDDPNNLIYARRARANTQDVVTTETGRIGIGTAAPTDRLQIVGGGIDLDDNQSVSFGAIGSVSGNGTNLQLASTGVITAQSAGGTLVTLNAEGLGIGVVAAAGRVLHTNTADGIQLGSLTAVTNVSTNLGIQTPVTTDDFNRVLITDNSGIVRYISADDLVSTASEWTFDDIDNDDVFDAGEKVYLRRLGNDANGDDVYIDAVGNVVASTAKGFQWGGGTANQITKTGLTVDGAYTVETGAASAVSFQENGSAVPWLHFDGTNGGSGAGAYLGRVGIGTSTPLAALHVVGNIIASNTAQTSDARFKKDIVELSGALKAIRAIRGVSYEFRANEFPKEGFDEATHLGFIAQELREVLPQAVFERADGYLAVDYSAVTPVLVEAMQELANKVESLEAENAALRGGSNKAVGAVSTKQLQELEARLAAMDARLEAAAGRK